MGLLVPYPEDTAAALEKGYQNYRSTGTPQVVDVSGTHNCTVGSDGPTFRQKRKDGNDSNPKGRKVRRGFTRIQTTTGRTAPAPRASFTPLYQSRGPTSTTTTTTTTTPTM